MSPEPKAAAPPPGPPGPEGGKCPADFFRSRAVLIAAFGACGLWMLGLVALAMFSANPVTLNQKQIRESDAIVTAYREGKVSVLVVTKTWLGADGLGAVTVTNLEDTRMPKGQEFLVPLQRLPGERYRVTPTSLPNKAPLVYPATPEAESQLQTLLESHGK